MKVEIFKEASKLSYKIERLDLDITKLEEISEKELTAWIPVSNIPTEMAEVFRVNLLAYLCQQREILTERFGML